MICLNDYKKFQLDRPCALSLGKFDGIHLGHTELIDYLREKKKNGLLAAVFTFDIPPKKMTEGNDYQVLLTNEEKQGLFEKIGIDFLFQCPFTQEIMCMEAEDFVRWIVTSLKVKYIVVGEDFRFGYQRKGDHKLLESLANQYGYEIRVIRKLKYEQRDISSTYVREEIAKGNMELANRLLGHCYYVEGTVVCGNQIGRTINVPTANLIPPTEKLLPPFGVYAVSIDIKGTTRYGIANVGRKPTIDSGKSENPIGVEAHIFNFSDDIYGECIRVTFYTFVRPERKFASLSDLKAQIKRDILFSKQYFAKELENDMFYKKENL
ncbi:MAG: bifunctional riboflavin kinase/FAD synthetase [bacterium]|nr:bifunctional riboflavin kinase/FAD synthetase [bacterium]